jgi:hypothetical protein
MKCVVRGCRHKLDDAGTPVEYCDYQQGRCPMQRRYVPMSLLQKIAAISLITVIIFAWVQGWVY